MSQQHINVSTPNDGLGDTLRTSQVKSESNFNDLYANKVDKSGAKILTDVNFSATDKAKLDSLDPLAGAQSDWNQGDNLEPDYIKNKPVNLSDFFNDIIDDSNLVHKTGDETISGIKTFEDAIYAKGFNSSGNVPVLSNGGIWIAGLGNNEFAQIEAYINSMGTPKELVLNGNGGKVSIGTTAIGGFEKLKVAGTITAYNANLSNEVVVKSQLDLKLDASAYNVTKATDNLTGTVKTDTYKADPVVYTKETSDNLLKAKVNAILEIKPITGITYTLLAYDTANLVQLAYDGTLPMTVTIPNDATLNLPVGSIFYTVGSNTGALTIAGGSGVTFQTAVGLTAGQNETRKYVKKVANIWQIEGGASVPIVAAKKTNTVFLSSTGNDSTAMPTDSSLPFLTLNACFTWMLAQSHLGLGWIVETLDNGTFYYTLASKTYNGFNITNFSGANIYLDNALFVNNQWDMNCPTGNVYFRETPTSVATISSSSFINFGSTAIAKHTIKNLFIQRTNTVGYIYGNGFIRSIPMFLNSTWTNLTIDANTAVGLMTNSNSALYGDGLTIINYNNYSTQIGQSSGLSIINYTNFSGGNQTISGVFCKIQNIVSPTYLVTLTFQYLSLNSNSSYQNTQFAYINGITVVNGNGNKLTINNTVAGVPIFAYNSYPKSTTTGFDINHYTLIKNLHLEVTAGSTNSSVFLTDFRGGRNGSTYILENCILNLLNSKPLLDIQSFYDNIPDYAIIFRGTVRIKNNYYLQIGGGVAGFNSSILVKENAQIYHDYGLISAAANFQTTIPNITSTY